MQSENLSLEIAPWVAWRSYLVGTEDSRTVVSNERDRYYLMFDGASSDIWAAISEKADYATISKLAKDLDASDELDDFLEELKELSLLGCGVHLSTRSGDDEITSNSVSELTESPLNREIEKEMPDWTAENGYLWSVHWELTYRCNEKCIHCINPVYEDSRNSKSRLETEKELTTKEALDLVDEFLEMGVFQLTLSGGEGTLRRDFLEIFKYARSKGFSVTVMTNGLKWKDNLFEQVCAHWPHSVDISVYSADPVEHDKVTRVPGSYERTLATYKKLSARGLKVNISSIQMKDTVKGYKAVEELGESLGADVSIDIAMFPKLNGDKDPQTHSVDSHDDLMILAATEGSPLEVDGSDEEREQGRNRFASPDDIICRAGRVNITVDPTGSVTPCLLFPLSIGSIKDTSVSEIWNKSVINTEGRNFTGEDKDFTVGNLIYCGQQEYCSYCSVCPGKNFLESGNPMMPAPGSCKVSKARYEVAELLRKGMSKAQIREMKSA